MDPQGEFAGKNIVFAEKTANETATYFKKDLKIIQAILDQSKQKLFNRRRLRPRPHLDDKILTDWNGLMISSLSFGARVLNEPRYLEAAERSARFIKMNLISNNGRLLHRFRDRDAAILGTIEDYAFYVHGLLDLYESTFNLDYLKQSIALAADMVELFWDQESGGFYFTAKDTERLLFKQKEIYDGAIPSGNSIATLDLLRIYHMTSAESWKDKVDGQFKYFASQISKQPSSYAQMLSAFNFAIGPTKEIVISASSNNDYPAEIVSEVYKRFVPNKVMLLHPLSGPDAESITEIAPYVASQQLVNGKTTVYLCEDRICKLPVTDLADFKKLLDLTGHVLKKMQ